MLIHSTDLHNVIFIFFRSGECDPEQLAALQLVCSGHHVCIAGTAGSG